MKGHHEDAITIFLAIFFRGGDLAGNYTGLNISHAFNP